MPRAAGSTTKTSSSSPEPHRRAHAPVGVILCNLGSPASPETADVRRYLAEFLADPRVVEANPVVWWLVRNLIVLPFRPRASAELYRRIWTSEGSPLIVESRRQAEWLARELGAGFRVRLAMRYGEPSIAVAVEDLCAAGCERIVLLPLFPQYSAPTSGSVYAAVYAALASRRVQPALRVVPPYFDDPGYIRALAARDVGGRQPVEAEHVVVDPCPRGRLDDARGDPYREHCERTAAALARELALPPERWSIVFQSRFGREPWLEPYADRYVPALARRAPRVSISMPGFTADCLETLEEIAIRLRERFMEAGGEQLVVVPALNDHPAWLDALAALVRREAPAG